MALVLFEEERYEGVDAVDHPVDVHAHDPVPHGLGRADGRTGADTGVVEDEVRRAEVRERRFQERPSGAASGAANWNPNQGLVTGGTPAPAARSSEPGAVSSAPLSPKAIESLGQPPSGVVQSGGATPPPGGNTPAPTSAATANLQYILQIGAYSNRNDAESQRAKVAFTGLEAHLDERMVNGRTLYRVRVGPYASPEQADKAQKLLNDNGIESAIVKVSK